MTTQDPTKRLLDAATAGNVNAAQAALDAGADVDAKEYSDSPLHLVACYGYTKGRTEIARLLIDKGADVNIKDSSQYTPLHWAANGGYADIARLLIDNGANLKAQEMHQHTPMDLALLSGHRDLAELLEAAAKNKPTHAKRVRKRRGGDEVQRGG